MPHVEVNGQRLFYTDSGGDGPAVLFSHGYLMDHTMFDPQVEALAPTYRCIRWDERGFGRTVYDGGAFTYWDSAADAIGLLDHLGVEHAVLAGMSQGGYLSLRAALAHPQRVRGLVLIDTFAGVDPPEQIQGHRELLQGWLHGSSEERQGIAEIVATMILGDPALFDAWLPRWLAEPPEALATPTETLLGRDDVSDRVPQITQPALVLHGTEDQAVAFERGGELADALPDCHGFVAVEGAAHAANLTHPEVVNPPIERFLGSLT